MTISIRLSQSRKCFTFDRKNGVLYESLFVKSWQTIIHRDARIHAINTVQQQKQESVRPRWPYDMRPSARAEKHMCVIVIRQVARRDATITGRTDRQTDRQSATHNAAPPREEGRIKREKESTINTAIFKIGLKWSRSISLSINLCFLDSKTTDKRGNVCMCWQSDRLKRESELVSTDAADVRRSAENLYDEVVHMAVDAANGTDAVCY